MKFQEKLVQLRKGNDLSQEQLAEKLGVSRQAISRWE
ncbi:MAG: helix-turn-helix transcriptional regulator, partial [Lachnospiraceae bacterium]|nr:helix-turn-helix transcriptional regulator [Lachnospiraceae bacterium]